MVKRLLVALVAALLMSGRRRATLIGSVTGVIAATALVSAASLANAASVTGGITSIDMAKDTFTLDNGSTLHAPEGVKLTEFRVGQKVTAPYVRRAGHVDATAIKLAGKIPNNANLRG